MLREQLQGESLEDGAKRMTAVRRIAREKYTAGARGVGVLIDSFVHYADGGYWVAARVWVADTEVSKHLIDPMPPEVIRAIDAGAWEET
jgi:hypothetical protein